MIRRAINRIHRIKEKDHTIKTAWHFIDFLTKGEYVFGSSEKVVVNRNEVDNINIHVFGENNENHTNRPTLIVANNGTKFDGSVLLITNNETVKIFSSNKKSIITIFKDFEHYCTYLEKYNKAKKLFPTPIIFKASESDCLVEEEYLRDDSTDEMKWHQLLDYWVDWYANNSTRIVNYSTFPLNHNVDKLQKFFEDYWSKNNNSKIVLPCIIQHGDMWKANVFVNKKEVHIIDYDELGEYVFFYDIMMYMFTEGFIGHNDTLLKHYLNGRFDERISSICNNFDVRIDEIGREQLFVAAFEEMIKKRFDDKKKCRVAFDTIDYLRKVGFCSLG